MTVDDKELLAARAAQVAETFMAFGMPSRVVCPSDEAKAALIAAISTRAKEASTALEVVEFGSEPVARLESVTRRLAGWQGRSSARWGENFVPTILVLSGFDVFGSKQSEAPVYPFRSTFQFDDEFRWFFLGSSRKRMDFLFNSYERPLYRAAMDLTPREWR